MQSKSRRTAILLCSCTAHRHTCTHSRIPFHCHVSICSTVDEDDDYDDSHRYSSARSVSWWHSTRTVCIHHHHRHRLELPFHISLDFLSTLSEESRVFYHQLVLFLFLFATNRFGFVLFKQEFDSPCDLLLLHVSDQEKKIKFQWRRKTVHLVNWFSLRRWEPEKKPIEICRQRFFLRTLHVVESFYCYSF